jgi:hypothetical protein
MPGKGWYRYIPPMRDSRFSPASAKMNSDQAILQQQLKMNVEQIDIDCVKWFRSSPGSRIHQSGNEPAYHTQK